MICARGKLLAVLVQSIVLRLGFGTTLRGWRNGPNAKTAACSNGMAAFGARTRLGIAIASLVIVFLFLVLMVGRG